MPSDLKRRLQSDLNAARKARDRDRTLVLSTALSDVRNAEIARGKEVSDEDVIAVLTRGIKQRRDAAEQFRAAGRSELADREAAQADALQAYLPEALDEAEVRGIVRELLAEGAQGVGQVMGRLMTRIRGRFDGKEANRIVREELG